LLDNVTAAERQREPTLMVLEALWLIMLDGACVALPSRILAAVFLITTFSLIALASHPLHRGNING
jgi:hypothetical protein